MTCGLVHASYSLPEWQAVKLTFFAPSARRVRSLFLFVKTPVSREGSLLSWQLFCVQLQVLAITGI